MVNIPRRFPCGEYFPGEEPRTPPTRGIDSLPQVFIPTRKPPYEPPFFPPMDPPDDPKFACVGESPGDQFATGGRRCVPCTGLAFNTAGVAISIDSGDRRCIHSNLATCLINCPRPRDPDSETKYACIGSNDQFLLGGKRCVPCTGLTINPAGVATAVNSTDPKCIHNSLAACINLCRRDRDRDPTGQTPGGNENFYKCVETPIRCTNPITGRPSWEPKPIKIIFRSKVPCTREEAESDVNEAGGYPFLPDQPYPPGTSPDGTSIADGFCLADSVATDTFWRGCRDSPILNDCTEPVDEYNSRPRSVTTTTNTTTTNSQSRPNSITSVSLAAGSIVDPQLQGGSIIASIPKKETTQLSLSNNELRRSSSSSGSFSDSNGLFDETYNFFRSYPPRQTTLVANSQYLNIFKRSVTEEVKYFLLRSGTNSAWHESMLNALTTDNITLSLNSDVLIALNNLHSIGNELVNFEDLITTIKSHLIAGTLNDFDINYYFHIYNNQFNDSLLRIQTLGETKEGLQFSLAMFEVSSQSPDYSRYLDPRVKNDYKRMRVLLEDINTNIPTLLIDGSLSSLYLTNAGVPTEFIESTSSFTNIGDGAGYYISALNILNEAYPLLTTNELSSSRYLPPLPRYAVLKTLGTDPGLVINVSSNVSGHEFAQNYNPSADVYPMYFKLNFDKLGDVLSPNSVVNTLSATYTKISDEEGAIHSRNYSFNIIKVNIDHTDPLIHYARDTSTMIVELDDFNLRSFDENVTPVSQNIILRNFPAAIILSPGLGSAHNPYNSKSIITNYGDPIVARSIEVTPSFEVNDFTKSRPPLEVSNIYNSIGTPYFGLYEKLFDQDIHGDIFTYTPSSTIFDKSYFFNGGYSNSQPASSFREGSIESKIAIGLVDKLANLSGVTELTYWDVYRRLTINDIGKLSLVNPKSFMRKLESGWRNNVPIKYVLSRAPIRPSGIPENATIINDQIIINEADRAL